MDGKMEENKNELIIIEMIGTHPIDMHTPHSIHHYHIIHINY